MADSSCIINPHRDARGWADLKAKTQTYLKRAGNWMFLAGGFDPDVEFFMMSK
jgi:hypothetical protein